MIRRWLLNLLLPDEIYVVLVKGVVVSAHTNFQSANEDLVGRPNNRITPTTLIVD